MKLKHIKYISLAACTAIMGTACSDFLEKEPRLSTTETYFKSESELNTFLTGVYSPIMQEHFYGNNYPLYLAGGDDLTFYQRSNPAAETMICGNANSSGTEIQKFWAILYDGINRANLLLENVNRNEEITLSTRQRIEAEALFLRAFYYFHLVQCWGDVPMRLESVKSAYGLDIERTDKQVVYDQLISDMQTAIPKLYSLADLDYTGRITREAAKGILARVYMFRAGARDTDGNSREYYEAALKWAKEVKDSANVANLGLVKPYNRVFKDLCEDLYNSTGVKESLWEAEEAGNRTSVEQAAGRLGNTLGFGGPDLSSSEEYMNLGGLTNPGYSYKFAYASLKLYEMYEAEGDTARGDWNITPFEYIVSSTTGAVTGRRYYYGKLPEGSVIQTGILEEQTEATSKNNKTRCAAKYRREYEKVLPKHKNYTPINFPILRYSDILLMIAEAENELNGAPTALAYECINAVRERADLEALPAGLSKDEFLAKLKNERAMEFAFEALRRWDLIRWGEFYTTIKGMNEYIYKEGWGSNYTYAADYYNGVSEAYVYFPIPTSELSVNNKITQNPGW